MAADFRARVYAILARVPEGRVVSYGQVAAWAGFPRRSRHVGRALAESPADVPWHRVVNARGQIRTSPPDRQADALRAEGVWVEEHRVDLATFGWQVSPLYFAEL